jgi:hypothetical protein
LLNDVCQRYNVRITEKHIGDMSRVQVFAKRRHNIPILHNIGFSPIDVRNFAWVTANASR